MVTKGINVTVSTVVAEAAPLDSPLVIGLVGTVTKGASAAANKTPVAVRNVAEAEAQFGTAGTLISTIKEIYALASCVVVGIKYDHSLLGNDLATEIDNAIDRLKAASATGFAPTIVGAPGITFVADNDGSASPVAVKLAEVAEVMGAYAIMDSADSTVAVAKNWQASNGGPRTVGVPQMPTSSRGKTSGSGFLMGLIAKNDAENGVKDSFSNRSVPSIVSVDPMYTFSFTDGTTEAQDLAANHLTVFVREGTEWIAFGGTTAFADADDPRRFVNAGRTFDRILLEMKSIGRSFIGRQLTQERVGRIITRIQSYLNTLVANEDILAGTVAADAVKNTAANLNAGKLSVLLSVDFVANIEQLNIAVEVM